MANSHYVPKLVLRKFSDKICLFNVKTGEYKEKNKIDKAFSELNFYTDKIEEKLNYRIESEFSNLFNNRLYNEKSIIELSRKELFLIKKFLLISVIRSISNEKFIVEEKNYYYTLKKHLIEKGISTDHFELPFIEKNIASETLYDYWMRSIEVILDTDGTPMEILKHPEKTYLAFRWSKVINAGFIAFWDSEYLHDEFIITDVGMTSENEKGWNGVTVHNTKKTNFLLDLIKKARSEKEKQLLVEMVDKRGDFTENFMMFPISAKRMIVEIDPFYKFIIENNYLYKMPSLSDLTMIPNIELFKPNKVNYILPQMFSFKPLVFHENDKYIYEIKKLSRKETRYCNTLFLDRINTWLGFSSLDKVVGSLYSYYKFNKFPYCPRVDYTELYELINEKYMASININKIGGWRR